MTASNPTAHPSRPRTLRTLQRSAIAAALTALALALAPAVRANSEPPPPRFTQPGARTVQFPTGLYDDRTDGATLIRLASERARALNKRVLVMWGENNCGFCAYLSDLLFYESPACRGLIDGEYELVKIDIAKTHTKHNDLAQKYGATAARQMEDAPRLTVIDPVADRGLGSMAGKDMLVRPMSMERVFDEAVVLPFLERHIAPPVPASSVLDQAASKALIEDKPVWIRFTQTGCAPCTALEEWAARPDVRPILDKAFVVARIDVNRMSGGKALFERFAAGSSTANADQKAAPRSAQPPASVLLSSRGQPLDPPARLDALPADAEQVAAWVETLQRAAGPKRLSDEDAAKLRASLSPKVDGGASPPK